MAGPEGSDDVEARAEALADEVAGTREAASGPALPPEAKIYRLHAPGADPRAVGRALGVWYGERNLKVQVIEVEAGCTVQCRSAQWRRVLGMATGLTVVLHRQGDDLVIEIGAAEWLERGVVATVGLWHPLLLGGAAWGAWEQSRLPEQTVQFIKSVASAATPATPPPQAPTQVAAAFSTMRRRLRQAAEIGADRVRTALAETVPREAPSPRAPEAPPAPEITLTAPPPDAAPEPPSTPAVRVDLHQATLEEVLAQTSLSRVAAEKVLAARRTKGGFTSLDEVAAVAGLRPHELERLRHEATLGPLAAPPGPAAGGRVIDV